MATTYIPKKRVTATGFERAIEASGNPFLHGLCFNTSENKLKADQALEVWRQWKRLLKGVRVVVVAKVSVGVVEAHVSFTHGTAFKTVEPFRQLQGKAGVITSLRLEYDGYFCGAEAYVRFDDGTRELIELPHLRLAPRAA